LPIRDNLQEEFGAFGLNRANWPDMNAANDSRTQERLAWTTANGPDMNAVNGVSATSVTMAEVDLLSLPQLPPEWWSTSDVNATCVTTAEDRNWNAAAESVDEKAERGSQHVERICRDLEASVAALRDAVLSMNRPAKAAVQAGIDVAKARRNTQNLGSPGGVPLLQNLGSPGGVPLLISDSTLAPVTAAFPTEAVGMSPGANPPLVSDSTPAPVTPAPVTATIATAAFPTAAGTTAAAAAAAGMSVSASAGAGAALDLEFRWKELFARVHRRNESPFLMVYKALSRDRLLELDLESLLERHIRSALSAAKQRELELRIDAQLADLDRESVQLMQDLVRLLPTGLLDSQYAAWWRSVAFRGDIVRAVAQQFGVDPDLPRDALGLALIRAIHTANRLANAPTGTTGFIGNPWPHKPIPDARCRAQSRLG
jgi:hypothetical protein